MTFPCPVCRTGSVVRAKYRRTGGVVAQCDGCPALWLALSQVDAAGHFDQRAYRRAHNLTDERVELEWIERDWSWLIDADRWRADPNPGRPDTEYPDPAA